MTKSALLFTLNYNHLTSVFVEDRTKTETWSFGEWGFLHIYCMKGQQCDDEEQIVLTPQTTTHCCDHNIEALKATSKATCFPLLYWVYDVNTKLAARDLHNQSCYKGGVYGDPNQAGKAWFSAGSVMRKECFLRSLCSPVKNYKIVLQDTEHYTMFSIL